MNIQQHPASVDAYIRHGWSLVPIPRGTKGPRVVGWNQRENCLRTSADLPPGHGIGLAHAYSGTMALDIDDWDTASMALALYGINLITLYAAPDAVIVDSGRQGHGKLLYSMPFGLALRSCKLLSGSKVYLEFRCATTGGTTVQDVLPPSIHPETGQSYRWAGLGHWSRLPVIPQPLLDLWMLMIDDPQTPAERDESVIPEWPEIVSAVQAISPDCSRDDWIHVGMALHWAGTTGNDPARAFGLWDTWSSKSTKYPGPRDMRTQWASFRIDKTATVKLGTLYTLAYRSGWTRPLPDASALFAGVTTPPQSENLIEAMRPRPPDMDMTLWPAVLATRAVEISNTVGCDPLAPLFSGLAAVCAVADAQIRLELMPGYQVPPILWLVTIGAPADKKTPGSYPMLTALAKLETEDRPRFAKEILDWEGKEAGFAAAKKSFLEWAASPEAMLGGDAPPVPELPPQPVPLKLTVSDITSQKLVRQLAARPRGMLCYLDEMNAWVRKLTDARSGEDRSAWVVSYEAKPYDMERVGAGSIHADNMALSIYGNLQPRVLQNNMAALSADGLIQRFIPAVLRGSMTRLGQPRADTTGSADAWENVLRLIYALPVQTYTLAPDAYTTFREFQAWYEAAKQDERLIGSNDTFMTAFGKLEGTTGRLALLLHLIEAPFSPQVSAATVKKAVTIVQDYVVPSFRFTFGDMGDIDSFDRWVTNYVVEHSGQQIISVTDLRRAARRQLEHVPQWRADQMIAGSMHVLHVAGWVRELPSVTGGSAATEWAINPDLARQFAAHRQKIADIKQARLDKVRAGFR